MIYYGKWNDRKLIFWWQLTYQPLLTWSTTASSKMCLPVHSTVGGKPFHWFKSHLYPRACKVNISKSSLSDEHLCSSASQGSLCGPVLYNTHANTMSTVVPTATAIHGYADDHALKKEFNSSLPQEEADTPNLSVTAWTRSRNEWTVGQGMDEQLSSQNELPTKQVSLLGHGSSSRNVDWQY